MVVFWLEVPYKRVFTMGLPASPSPGKSKMPNVLILRKTLTGAPRRSHCGPDASIRSYRDGDATNWLRLQSAALPSSQSGREWTKLDFAREFLAQPWWSPERMLFALAESERIVGTVTLGRRGPEDRSEATIHWLLVEPKYQRLGIATRLVSQLEQICWDSGWPFITLETLSTWKTALAFYTARGYIVSP